MNKLNYITTFTNAERIQHNLSFEIWPDPLDSYNHYPNSIQPQVNWPDVKFPTCSHCSLTSCLRQELLEDYQIPTHIVKRFASMIDLPHGLERQGKLSCLRLRWWWAPCELWNLELLEPCAIPSFHARSYQSMTGEDPEENANNL